MKAWIPVVLLTLTTLFGCTTNHNSPAVITESTAYEELRARYATIGVARVVAGLKYSEIYNPEEPTQTQATLQRLDPDRVQELTQSRAPDLPPALSEAITAMASAGLVNAVQITTDNADLLYFYTGDQQQRLAEIDPLFNTALGVVIDLNQQNGISLDYDPEVAISFGGTQLSDSGPGCIGCFIPFITCSGCPTDGGVTFPDFELDDRIIQTIAIGERIGIPLDSFPQALLMMCEG